MSHIRRKPVGSGGAQLRYPADGPDQMEDIELDDVTKRPNANVHPLLRARPNSGSRPAISSTVYSDPGSYNAHSLNSDSTWSHRRLLKWIRSPRDSDTTPSSAKPYSGPRELGADEYHLAMTGYEQVFRRIFTPWDNALAMLATMGIATSLPALLLLVSIYAGGPKAALTNWLVIGALSLVVALCLGEIAAAMPTSAGLYFFSYRLGGKQSGPFLSWITAWLSWIGWLTVVPASAQLSSNFMLSIFTIHYHDAAFVQHPWFHWFIILVTLTFFVFLPNVLSRYAILWALRLCIATSALLIMLYVSWFPSRVGDRFAPSNLLITENRINTGNMIYVHPSIQQTLAWSQKAKCEILDFGDTDHAIAGDTYAWALAALLPAWTFKGFEVSVAMAEETKKASKSVATGMWVGVLAGWLLGIPVIVVLLSCVVDIRVLANAGRMFPQGFALYLLAIVGHNGALFMLVLAWLDAALVTAVMFMAAQRLTFALARDEVSPYKDWISRVSKNQLPVNAGLVVFGYSFFISMIGVIGPSTFQTLLAIAVIAQNLSYAIVIFARLTYGRRSFQSASWNLRKASVPLNVIALAYTGYLFMILILPFWFPISAEDFNFAPIALMIILLLALVTWYAPKYGKHRTWKGPRIMARDDLQLANTPPDRSPKHRIRL